MIKGQKAEEAAKHLIESIRLQRLQHPTGLSSLYYSFPRIKLTGNADWFPASVIVVSSIAAIMSPKDPPTVRVKDLTTHPIPSYMVTITGVMDLEYHVSKYNMEQLLSVQCIVITPSKRDSVNVRIPEEIVTQTKINRLRKMGMAL